MIKMFIFFTFFLYCICEMTKFRKLASMRIKSEKYIRLYNKPVVYIKMILIVIELILVLVNRFTKDGVLERSTGVGGILYILALISIFIVVSVRDVIKVKNGHNEEIYKNSNMTKEECEEYE